MSGGKPKLLLFSHLCNPTFVTGAEKLLMLITRELIHRFHCVLVVPREGIIAAQARSLGVRVQVFDMPLCVSVLTANQALAGELRWLTKQFVYQRLQAFLVRERPSCVWVNTSVHPLPALAASSMGIPTAWAIMETLAHTPYRGIAMDTISAASHVIVGISRTTLLPFQGHPGEHKTMALPPYVNRAELDPPSWPAHRFHLRQQLGWGEECRVVGYIVAAIYESKGLEYFIRAAVSAGTADPAARFLVVGDPVDDDYFERCEKLVRQAGMSNKFAWIRFAEHIQQVYPAMDVVVIPSLIVEGFGMTALEGLYFGKPVIAFASGGLTEILTDTGNESFLVPTGNVPEMAARLQWILEDETSRLAVGNRNESAAEAVFGIDVFRVRLNQLADRLLIRPEFVSPLLRARGTKTVYLVENGRRRRFVSGKALLQREFRYKDVRRVPSRELRVFGRGPSLRERITRRRHKRKRIRSRRSAARTRSRHAIRTSARKRHIPVRMRKRR